MPHVPDIFEQLVRTSRNATVRLRVRSSLNPLLWLCGIVCPTCFGFALLFDGWPRAIIALAGVLPVLFACGSFVYLMLRRPDDLKSEEFQLQKMALERIETRGGTIAADPMTVSGVANPSRPALTIDAPPESDQ